MNTFFKIFIGIVLAVALFFVFNPDQKITNYPSSGKTIVAFGDSLIQGVGATEGNDMISKISKKIGLPIVNLGVSGNTTIQGLSRIESVKELDPKMVILLLGGNDYLKKIPREDTFKNLSKIIDEIHSTGAVVVLLGVKGGVLGDPFEKEFEKLAKEKKVLYVSNVLDGLIGNMKYMSDAIHPNDLGYEIIAERVVEELRKGL